MSEHHRLSLKKTKGDKGNWGRDSYSKKQQKYIDDNGINPHRPYGTSFR